MNLAATEFEAINTMILQTDYRRLCDSLPTKQRWSAAELMQKMDRVAGYDVFVPLYRRYVVQPRFPDLKETYRLLGLESNSNELRFSNDVIGATLRHDIMGER